MRHLVLGLTLTCTSLFAQESPVTEASAGGRDDFAARGGRLVERLRERAEALGITESQREAMRASFQQHAAIVSAARSSVRDARIAFAAASRERPTNVEAIERTSHALASAVAAWRIAGGAARDDVRVFLTPEQRSEIDAGRAKLRATLEARLQRRRAR